jgi:hypothetical protein
MIFVRAVLGYFPSAKVETVIFRWRAWIRGSILHLSQAPKKRQRYTQMPEARNITGRPSFGMPESLP